MLNPPVSRSLAHRGPSGVPLPEFPWGNGHMVSEGLRESSSSAFATTLLLPLPGPAGRQDSAPHSGARAGLLLSPSRQTFPRELGPTAASRSRSGSPSPKAPFYFTE